MKSLLFLLVLASALAGAAAGCARKAKGPDVPIAQQEAFEKARAQVNLLHPSLDGQIAAELTQTDVLEDGRLRAITQIRNRTRKNLQVQYRTVFKNSEGLSTGDETAWENLYLEPMQATTLRQTSLEPAAAYTVEVRSPKKRK